MNKPVRKLSKKKQDKREIRLSAKPQQFTIRKNADGTRSVSGYFATFGTMSYDLGFREVLQKNCFADSLASNPVACYRDHNPEMLLGKTQSGTLQVSEDDKGLKFSVKLPDTTYANDLINLMERADAYECSFGFSVASDGDEWSQLPNGEILRTITKAVLYEGSILTGPPAAYPNTSANLRSCPVSLRSKLKRDDDDDDSEIDCNDPDNIDDPRCDDPDDEDRCECRCDECRDDNCEDCTNQDCTDDDCDECPIQQTRAAHAALLIRRLRS